MRTTLDIEDDELAAAKELARQQGLSAGQVVSRLLRSALLGDHPPGHLATDRPVVAGFRPFMAPGQKLVTNEQIDQLRGLK
jgi:hypothetical protein